MPRDFEQPATLEPAFRNAQALVPLCDPLAHAEDRYGEMVALALVFQVRVPAWAQYAQAPSLNPARRLPPGPLPRDCLV